MGDYQRFMERYMAAHFVVTKNISIRVGELTNDELTKEQFNMLGMIHERQSCTSTELAEVFMVCKSSITAIINRLVDRGFVQRTSNPHDRRQINLSLTESGTETYVLTAAKLMEVLGRYLVQFPDEEVESFISSYEKLAHLMGEGGSA